MRTATLRGREMFVAVDAPGRRGAGGLRRGLVILAGVERKAHYLAMDLPQSDDCFVVAFPAETTRSVPRRSCAGVRVPRRRCRRASLRQHEDRGGEDPGGEQRQRTRSFSELLSHYLFADKFGRPAKGNDKGKVEGLVGYARRNFMVPVPRFQSWTS